MLKANATLIGTIFQPATVRQTRDGRQYTSISVKVTIPPSRPDQQPKETLVYVSADGVLPSGDQYFSGRRIECEGTLNFRKRGDALYLNFQATRLQLDTELADQLSGTVDFRGTVGKTVTAKTTSKGNPYLSFSGYSAEKVGDNFTYTWVRFLKFDGPKPDWLEPKTKIRVTGPFHLFAYNGAVSISCRIETLEQRQSLPFPPSTNAPSPF